MAQSIQLPTPFHFGWYSFGLPGYRPCHSTYELYPYDNLPPIPEDQLIGKLQWLAPLDRDIDAQMQPHRFPAKLRAEWHPLWIESMKEIVALSQLLGLSLPDVFLQFNTSLVSPSALGNISQEEIIAHAYVCAPSFEAFLYRFWLENVLSFNLIMRKPLSKEQMHYLSYYKR